MSYTGAIIAANRFARKAQAAKEQAVKELKKEYGLNQEQVSYLIEQALEINSPRYARGGCEKAVLAHSSNEH